MDRSDWKCRRLCETVRLSHLHGFLRTQPKSVVFQRLFKLQESTSDAVRDCRTSLWRITLSLFLGASVAVVSDPDLTLLGWMSSTFGESHSALGTASTGSFSSDSNGGLWGGWGVGYGWVVMVGFLQRFHYRLVAFGSQI